MMQFNTRQLVTVNLKYGTSAKPLKTLAFAELIAKVMYSIESPVEVQQLVSESAKMIGNKSVSSELVIDGLQFLQQSGKVRTNGKTWQLENNSRKDISREINTERGLLREVLERHFPATLPKKILKMWFRESSADFLGFYCDEWIKISSKGNRRIAASSQTIEQLLSNSIKNNKLEQHKQALVAGFVSFLSSDNIRDQQYLFLMSQAMFSARLVAADIGIDPITIEELSNSTFIFDTNVLFALSLESSRLWQSIKALEGAFKFLNSKLIYLHCTTEEYARALNAKRGDAIHVIKAFDDEVIQDVRDDFIATARDRGCKNEEDYNRFFDSLLNIPRTLPDGLNIVLEDDKEFLDTQIKSEQDEHLKNQIQKFALKFRAKWKGKKGQAALNHDTCLIHTVDYLRGKNEKAWILSLDRSLQASVLEQTPHHELPKLLSVSVLIEILALNNSEPISDATNFAPLLSKLLLNECLPSSSTYILQDLQLLDKINERAADLPSEEVKKLVKEIAKARLEGKAHDSNLALRINRLYQASTIEVSEQLSDAKERIKRAEEETNQERIKSVEREKELNNFKAAKIKRDALGALLRGLLKTLPICGMGSLLVAWGYCKIFNCGDYQQIIRDVLAALPILYFIFWPLKKLWGNYKASCQNASRIRQ